MFNCRNVGIKICVCIELDVMCIYLATVGYSHASTKQQQDMPGDFSHEGLQIHQRHQPISHYNTHTNNLQLNNTQLGATL